MTRTYAPGPRLARRNVDRADAELTYAIAKKGEAGFERYLPPNKEMSQSAVQSE